MFNKVRLLASALCVIGLGVMGCKSSDECAECAGSQYGYAPTSTSSYPTAGYPAPSTAQPSYSSVPTTGTMMPQTMPMQGQ